MQSRRNKGFAASIACKIAQTKDLEVKVAETLDLARKANSSSISGIVVTEGGCGSPARLWGTDGLGDADAAFQFGAMVIEKTLINESVGLAEGAVFFEVSVRTMGHQASKAELVCLPPFAFRSWLSAQSDWCRLLLRRSSRVKLPLGAEMPPQHQGGKRQWNVQVAKVRGLYFRNLDHQRALGAVTPTGTE
jgi:hypothetical protein